MSPNQYSAISADSSTGNAATILSPVPINFSGQTINGMSSAFTLGGWFRLSISPTQSPQNIFNVEGQFEATVNLQGALSVGFPTPTGEGMAVIVSCVTDSYWHYLAISFQQDTSRNGYGTLTVYLDGFELAVKVVHSTVPLNSGHCVMGKFSTNVDFASWSLWNLAIEKEVMDAPIWGPPQVGSKAATGLVVAFDFARMGVTSSNPAIGIQTTPVKIFRPALRMNNGGSAEIDQPIPLPISGSYSWSLLSWVSAPSLVGNSFSLYYVNDLKNSFEIVIANNTISILQNGQALLTDVWPVSLWNHVAVTLDKNTMRLSLFINGVLSSSAIVVLHDVYMRPLFAVAKGTGDGIGSIQALSVWGFPLSVEQINQYLNGAEPLGEPGLWASFALMIDLGDASNLNAYLTVTNGTLVNDDGIDLNASMASKWSVKELELPVIANKNDYLIYSYSDYKNLASKNSLTSDALLSTKVSSEMDSFIEPYLSGVDEKMANLIRSKYKQNLRIGMEMGNRKIRTGQIELKSELNQTVYYFHAEDGPHEIYRSDLILSPKQLWAIQIAIDVAVVVASMFGIPVQAQAVARLEPLFAPLIPAFIAAAAPFAGRTANAIAAIKAVIKVIWDSRLLLALIKRLLTGNFWSIVFAALLLVAQIVAFIIGLGAASIAIKVAQMAISIAQLVNDLTHMPTTLEDASPENPALPVV